MRKKCLFFLPLLLVLLTGCEKKCPDGFTMDGNKCIREIERFEAEAVYDCEEDTILEGINCVRNIFVEPSEGTGCEDGLTLENGYCVGTLKESPVDAYKCNIGTYNSKTGKCDVLTYVSKVNASCKEENDIVLDNGKCAAAHPGAHSYGEPGEVDPATECCCGDTFKNGWCYSLPNGNYDATLTCPNGSKYTSGDKGKACYKESTSDATSYKKCNSGYTLSGNECTKSVKEKVGKVLTCESEFTLEDNQCKKIEVTPAKVNYNCPSDYEVVDKYCVKREVKEVE